MGFAVQIRRFVCRTSRRCEMHRKAVGTRDVRVYQSVPSAVSTAAAPSTWWTATTARIGSAT